MRKLALVTTAVAGIASLPVAVDAAPRYRGGAAQQHEGYVIAESRWGHGWVSGPVRPGRNGYQVRLPGGTWVDCVRNNCSETLRLQTVDVFETMGVSPLDGGPGYFRWQRRY
jgi:hypothetical protein